MKDDLGRKNAKCPNCNESLERIYTAPQMFIKKERVVGTKGRTSFGYRGEEVSFGFADHGKMDGVSKNSVGKKMSGVRVDDKTGRLVVDVVSNQVDPLGKLEKTKGETVKKNVSQRYKRR